MIALRCSRLHCDRPDWTHGPSRFVDISLSLQEGMLHGILGAPGSGKTLLLHTLSLLEAPDSGSIELFGNPVPRDEDVRAAMRNTAFGYVFANPCLLPRLSVAENIAMPLFRIASVDEYQASARVSELLAVFGLGDIGNLDAESLPPEIQHQVALARALVHRPRILALVDPARPVAILPLVRLAVESFGVTCLWSFNDSGLSGMFDRELTLESGRIASERVSIP